MMSSAETDIVAEAAEEQSPDSKSVSRMKTAAVHLTRPEICKGCQSFVRELSIKCAECKPDFLLCMSCFSCGFELDGHKNSHRYEIVRNVFPLFEYNWTAAEEMRLLEALSDCGVGNWSAIAKQVLTKTAAECATHYMKYYIVNARYPLPEFPNRNIARLCPPVPFKACENPCRPLPESHRAVNMAGYLAARGDFADEHLNAAECDIKDVQFCSGEWPILKALKISVVKIYHSRLVERRRRKETISRHGLINSTNHRIHFYSKLDGTLQQLEERLRPVVKLQHPIAQDKMFAGIIAESRLIKKITKLHEYRRAGIKSLRIGKLYGSLASKRLQLQNGALLDKVLSCKNDQNSLVKWLQTYPGGRNQAVSSGQVPPLRKSAVPIDISVLPGVERLNSQEKKFCSSARIVPEAYIKYKNILIAECEKSGGLKLAQARSLVKIDVNKTRKLYDFMLEQGYFVKKSCDD